MHEVIIQAKPSDSRTGQLWHKCLGPLQYLWADSNALGLRLVEDRYVGHYLLLLDAFLFELRARFQKDTIVREDIQNTVEVFEQTKKISI